MNWKDRFLQVFTYFIITLAVVGALYLTMNKAHGREFHYYGWRSYSPGWVVPILPPPTIYYEPKPVVPYVPNVGIYPIYPPDPGYSECHWKTWYDWNNVAQMEKICR